MGFPSSNNFHIKLSSFCVLLLSVAATFNPVFALKNCDFRAIFNFGDSNSDTGGFAALFGQSPPPPNGETYFHKSAGRFSDGRLLIDFIANSLHLPYISAYLDSLGTNFTQGANFATAASTVRLPHSIIPEAADGYSPVYLSVQYLQFQQFLSRSQAVRKRGGAHANLLPKREIFGKALYTFDIGQNDLGARFFGNKTIEEVNASVPDVVNCFLSNVKNVYNLGARTFWIHNTGPIGCLPYILANFPLASSDSYEKDLPLAAITYVDVYSIKYSIFTNPKKYGFEEPLVACCGNGGKYNYTGNLITCGRRVVVNGTLKFIGSCGKPSIRVNWDGVHFTEAANKFIFNQISTGAFSNPPIPLSRACHSHTEKSYHKF
ncbi:GDSL esterase/lipase [Quillaja saponaria]|uniref:GDSL esterase/lipase n=1 Tax=Quillaja saponaria TaxID=32244 RepID=A0AAD7PLT1_QUISA|nr:GDSL esterase/lipase [Quillaja saponaria]